MRWRASTTGLGALLLLALVVALAGTGGVWGAFTRPTSSNGNELRAAPDFVAPAVAASVIQKAAGGTPGYVRPGGAFRVLADVSDSGNPASGTTAVTANAGSIASGQTAAALPAGSVTAGGRTYGFRSASLTAGASLANGTYSYTVSTADAAGNTRTQTGLSVVVDGTAPTAAAVSAVNRAGGTAGRPEAGDVVTLTYSEPLDPASVLSGWTGAATSVVAHIDNDMWPLTPRDDMLSVYSAGGTTQLPLGSVDLGRRDYVAADRTFGATGTATTMTLSGNAVVLVLGTASGSATTAAAAGTLTWTPSASATDRAGNPATTTARADSSAANGSF